MKHKRGIIWPVLILCLLSSTSLVGQESFLQSGQLIKIETLYGNITILLYNDTPNHRDNMIKLINEGFYNDQLFHRVIKDFMIQGGDPHSKGAEKGQRLGTGGPGYTIPAEFSSRRFHKKGALAAARMGDQINPQKESSGSQFYIVQGRVFSTEMLKQLEQGRSQAFTSEEIEAYTTLGGSPHLDGAYTVFGEVVEGLELVDIIASMQTDSNNRPVNDVIYRITLVE